MSGFAAIAPLFVPADRPERYAKAAASGADAVIVDLEDAVAPARKAMARAALAEGFATLPAGVAAFVRVNAAGTAWHEDDLAAIVALPVAGIVLAKAETPAQAERAAMGRGVIALIESARGMAMAREIAASPAVRRLAFGSIDYCADLGATHLREVLLPARAELVLASRLAGLAAPLDGVTPALDDAALIEDDARHAMSLGFGGKLCIHPKQIGPARAGFAPAAAEIDWARQILAAGDEGAVAVGGTMVDAPVRLRARQILARAGETREQDGTA
ncbi:MULTISPECIES: CoA ester lyase [unclassified Acidiphilium]|uniref:HpcH/HpaI aldolase/citrate lyase family protein n=1 Tax=unclassified Acidiphilium TaxID=2617493 RepID=UPI000BD46652|nr:MULTISPECIES: CoA ester lyase [unclassified Acidiphilium]OYV57038.1 MAG: CoA ester lyase [Acidiphilium sp. 20-67-58]HQT61793.1 CoA ester lyase [Acidiphilium sp.]